MGVYVFNNQIFDNWLTKMSEEILSKVNREKITTEEMIILILKAQTNHFHHMDVELKDEMDKGRTQSHRELKELRLEFKSDMNELRTELTISIDKSFDRLYTFLMWSFGFSLTMTLGLYVKLFLG